MNININNLKKCVLKERSERIGYSNLPVKSMFSQASEHLRYVTIKT